MGLMGTLAKVAIGYAAARGVDKLAGDKGLAGLMSGEAGNLQDIMGKLSSSAQSGATDLQNMMAGLMGGSTLNVPQGDGGGGLMSSVPGGGTGIAGLLAAAGGMAAMGGKGVGGLLDQFNTKDTMPEAEATAGLMLRAMIQAAKADGAIDEMEQAKILETVGEDADADDIAFVKDQLTAPMDIEGLAADTPEAQKTQVYAMSLMSIRVDTPAEAQYLDQLSTALGLDNATVNRLHAQMGLQPLYS